MKAKAIYDKINGKSGGVYASSSQGQWLRDTSQVYRQKKKNPWGKNLTMICRMSFVCKVKAANWYARSPSLVKAIKLFLATMSNYKMLNCFVATITVFYQFIQLSIFVTVGSLTLVTTIKGWWILMIIQYSWVQPWSILKRIHRSFVGFY